MYARSIATLVAALSVTLAAAPALAKPGMPNAPESGITLASQFAPRDPHDAQGRIEHARNVMLTAGETVDVSASSTDFDATLSVVSPSGRTFDNDDAPGEGTNAHVHFVAPATGTYRVVVSSFRAGETGRYSLTVAHEAGADTAPADEGDATDNGDESDDSASNDDAAPAPAPVPAPVPDNADDTVTAGAHTYGIFVGISNYGNGHDLEYTADDARNLARAFEQRGVIRANDAIVLTDAQATPVNIQRAFRTLGPRVTPRDTFVFFFDGHGSQQQIVLENARMDASTLRGLLDGVSGRQLVVLDSCYSGSLASLAQGRRDRVALLSSRSDETSQVAEEFNAGGYLAYAVIQAVRGAVDPGADGVVQGEELEQAAMRSYRANVHGGQHLVVAGDANTMLWHPALAGDVAVATEVSHPVAYGKR